MIYSSALIVPDLHVPFEDKKAVKLMYKVAKDLKKLKQIVLLGDVLDFYSVSSHLKSPQISDILENEIDAGYNFLAKMRNKFLDVEIKFIEGNHENRLTRYINKNSPDLTGLLKTEDLLDLEYLDIEWIPYGPEQLTQILDIDDLCARHEPYSMSVNYMRQTAMKVHKSLMFGHTHQAAYRSIRNAMGKRVKVWSCGHLVQEKHPCFNYYRSSKPWEKGFCIVHKTKNEWFVDQITISDDYEVIYNGKSYRV